MEEDANQCFLFYEKKSRFIIIIKSRITHQLIKAFGKKAKE